MEGDAQGDAVFAAFPTAPGGEILATNHAAREERSFADASDERRVLSLDEAVALALDAPD